jgi:ankyrin repeat protein
MQRVVGALPGEQSSVQVQHPQLWSLMNVSVGVKNAPKLKSLLSQPGARELINYVGKYSRTLLSGAAMAGQTELVNLLIKEGAVVNLLDGLGFAPLHVASGNGHVETADILMENGANIEIPDIYGQTPLFHAANYSGHTTITKNLLRRGANTKATTKYGSALHVASTPECVRYLCAMGADVSLEVKERTPLDAAILHKRLRVARALVICGADPTAFNLKSPISNARRVQIIRDLGGINEIHRLQREWRDGLKQFRRDNGLVAR